MTVSNAAYLKGFYDQTTALGAKVISSDFTMEIEGFEDKYLLCKQAPWPVLSTTGEIEVPTPLGATLWEPQQLKVAQQGQVSMFETVAGDIDQLLVDLITRSGTYAGSKATFNAKIYEGTPQKFLRAKRIVNCFLQLDIPDRDWENRSQVLTFSGTLFYHYFGDIISGNSSDYR
ncbi:MAG: hypothetical protein NC211_03605 [Alistipes senegalensis]|nr:hypothetical protein [Oxalobacter formigenes]MCM1280904.1 hypothetical protein [Alistipes senegalensis]